MDPAENATVQPDQPAVDAHASNGNSEGAGVQGQGSNENEGHGLYDQILGVIPEALRGQVEPHLKEWDGNVTRKFQEAAEFRKQWEPYGETGLSDFTPEQVSELVQFAQLAQDPEKFGEFLLNEARARDLLPDDAPELGDDELEDDGGELTPESIKEIFSGLLDERLSPIEKRFSGMDEEARIDEAGKEIRSTLDSLKESSGDFDEERVMRFALSYSKDGVIGPEAIKAGHKDLQSIIADAEKGLFKQKSEQPETPEQGGKAPTGTEPITNFKEASKAALEMARHST